MARRERARRAWAGGGGFADVSRVVDGDAIVVHLNGGSVRVRLIGVDTPESTNSIECYGKVSSKFTTDQLQGETVELEYDVDRYDKYGRTLAYVWLDDSCPLRPGIL